MSVAIPEATTTYGKERILAKPRFVNQTQPIEDGPPNIKMEGNDRQQANKDNITRPTNLENTTSSANVDCIVDPGILNARLLGILNAGAVGKYELKCFGRYSTGHEIRIDFRGTFCGRVPDAVRDFPRESAGRPPGECDTFCGRVRYVQREPDILLFSVGTTQVGGQ
ncbi:hypothetical protein Bbelb_054450 [Branchiostoma belcheri]|nr:hypothetical protein Bbelb_054450 [Branchiostoma belcheri]